ncbi:hypothetical protein GCM10010182_09230 [Actinomadura cremea]|nr:hypothetical protein GCM10010182_09230 [Actinomadura cremea]
MQKQQEQQWEGRDEDGRADEGQCGREARVAPLASIHFRIFPRQRAANVTAGPPHLRQHPQLAGHVTSRPQQRPKPARDYCAAPHTMPDALGAVLDRVEPGNVDYEALYGHYPRAQRRPSSAPALSTAKAPPVSGGAFRAGGPRRT